MIDSATDSAPARKKPILGIISIVLGGVSLLPFLGIASLIGIVVGIVAYVRERHVTGIIGTVLSVAGIATSPTVWGLFLSLWIRVDCMIVDCSAKISNAVQATISSPDVQKKVKKFVLQGVGSSFAVTLPPEWKQADTAPSSIFFGTNFFLKHYYTAPAFKGIMLETMESKKSSESLDAFIDRFTQEKLKGKNPNLQVTPMASVKINNQGDADKNTAQMRRFSNTSLGGEELVAYVDGGPKVFIFVAAAPTYNDLKAIWPVFYTALVNGVNFQVTLPSPPAASR